MQLNGISSLDGTQFRHLDSFKFYEHFIVINFFILPGLFYDFGRMGN